MLDRLNALEEKLDALLRKMLSMQEDLESSEDENKKLRKRLKQKGSGDKAGSKAELDAVSEERDDLAKHLNEARKENRKLTQQIDRLEDEIAENQKREKETLNKLQTILSRIDALETEIGELQNE